MPRRQKKFLLSLLRYGLRINLLLIRYLIKTFFTAFAVLDHTRVFKVSGHPKYLIKIKIELMS